MKKLTHYEVLEVWPKASVEIIDASFRTLSKKCHPDLFPGDAKAEEHFKRLTQAHDVLKDRDRRMEYDLRLRGFIQTPSPATRKVRKTVEQKQAAQRADDVASLLDTFLPTLIKDPAMLAVFQVIRPDLKNYVSSKIREATSAG